MNWLLYLVAIASGAANPFQSGTNSELNKQLAQPLWAAITVYGTGLAGLLLIQLFVRQPLPDSGRMAGTHAWAWLGGLISLAPTVAGLMLAQKMGSSIFTGLTLTASILTSVALDHFGLIGFKQHTASPMRLAGCLLMVGGLWLINRF